MVEDLIAAISASDAAASWCDLQHVSKCLIGTKS